MPKFNDYEDAGELDGSEILIVKQGTATKRTTVGAVADVLRVPQMLFGSADPDPNDGSNDDTWTNTETGEVFKKIDDDWIAQYITKGQDGDDGTPGEDSTIPGPPGPPGALFLGVTRWESDDSRIGTSFDQPGLYRLTMLADPEADPPVEEEWEFLRYVPPALSYQDYFDTIVNLTAADLWRIAFIYAAPADNAEVTVNVPGGLWAGPGLAPLWIQIGTQNPVKFQAPTGVNFRNPANGQVSNSFTIAAGNRWKWVNILTLVNLHRVL